MSILAAAKPARKKGEIDDIKVCLDVRFLNDRIQEVSDNNLPLLRDIIDKLENFKYYNFSNFSYFKVQF